MSGTTISSSGRGQKAPIFSVKKAGFVIPKNKLTGSLVPVFRGAKKPGPSDAFSGNETTKHVSRDTKWGPDLTQDPAVRKARALAYQTRVDQITRIIKSGISVNSDADQFEITAQSPDHEFSGHETDVKNLEQLELEKREAIGEILKINPSYKVPPDYTPVLKEDRVSIPVKEYPGYNFVGLIFGPGGDNQKHLEKETGAKIQVFGTARGESRKKVEILPSESNKAYDELHVRISADTFEKVDAAISVIELLITSVAGNLAANDDDHVPSSQDAAPSGFSHNSSMLPEFSQTQPLGQLGYPNHEFPSEPPSYPRPPISSAMPLNNPAHLQTPPLNAHSMFGFPQVQNVAVGFNSNPQNTSLTSANTNPPPQVLQLPYVAQTNPTSISQLPRNPSNISAPSMGITRPSMMPPLPQPNAMPMAPNHVQSSIVPPTLLNTPLIGHPPPMLASLIPSSLPVPAPASGPFIGNALGSASLPPMSLHMSISGSVANFTHLRQQLPTAPNPGNFSFHHLSPQNPAVQTIPRQLSNQLVALNTVMPANPMHHTPSPWPPASHLHLPDFAPQSLNHGFPRASLTGNNMGQPQTHIPIAAPPAPFLRNPIRVPGPSGLQAFPDGSSLPRNFGPTLQGPPIFPGPRSGNHVQLPRFNNNLGFAPSRPVSTPVEQLYDPFSPTSMSITPRQQGGMWRQ